MYTDEAPGIPGLPTIGLVVATTILLSVYNHRITSNPAIGMYIGRYVQLVAWLSVHAPEKKGVLVEVPTGEGMSRDRTGLSGALVPGRPRFFSCSLPRGTAWYTPGPRPR